MEAQLSAMQVLLTPRPGVAVGYLVFRQPAGSSDVICELESILLYTLATFVFFG